MNPPFENRVTFYHHKIYEDFAHLDANKMASLNDVTVSGKAMIASEAQIVNSRFRDLAIQGHLTLRESQVNGNLTVKWISNLENSTIQGTVFAYSNSLKLSHTQAQEIKIESMRSYEITTIYLDDRSVILKDITFVNGKGQVYCNESVVCGKVRGGELKDFRDDPRNHIPGLI